MKQVQALRGMHDLLPGKAENRRWIERQLIATAVEYGFSEIRTPLIEQPELFLRSIGEVTDIVEKEMYIFSVRGDKRMALRPEYTAGCVRALIEHGLITRENKLWYLGAMFRYERPQAGRYRQFHQFGVEHFGGTAPTADVMMLALSNRLWRKLGITAQLEINTIGRLEQRQQYNRVLTDYLNKYQHLLDGDSQRRLTTNPLRILDSKEPQTLKLLAEAPQLIDYIDDQSRATFAEIQASLDDLGIAWRYNPRLVRGLDYYNDLVFEWTTDQLGSQSAICAGGRYDHLAGLIGSKKQIPATGFALGIERLELVLEKNERIPPQPQARLYFVNALPQREAMRYYHQLHDQLPGISIGCDLSGSSLKNQFKKADKSGAEWALIIGEQEDKDETVSIKSLRCDEQQIYLPLSGLGQFFSEKFSI